MPNWLHFENKMRKSNGNRISEEMIANVRAYINSFPTVDPHYAHKSSTQKYLSPSLNITKMYQLYVTHESHLGRKYVRASYYFNTQLTDHFTNRKKILVLHVKCLT